MALAAALLGVAVQAWIVSSALAQGLAPELYVVGEKRVTLYRDRAAVGFLPPGQIVRATRNEHDRDWLLVQYQGQAQDAMRQGFLSRPEVEERLLRDIAACTSKTERLTDMIDANRERLLCLYAAIAAIGYDSTVVYRVPVSRIPAAVPGMVPAPQVQPRREDGGTVAPSPFAGAPVTAYREIDRISLARARRQARKWDEEVEAVLADARDCEQARRQAARDTTHAEFTLKRMRDRFAGFERTGNGDDTGPWCVTAREAVLYEGRIVTRRLEAGTVVMAWPNPKFQDWLRVQVEAKTYDGLKKYFQRCTAIAEARAADAADAQQELADLAAAVERLRSRERFLRFTGVTVQRESRLNPIPAPGDGWPASFHRADFYEIEICPAGATEAVDRGRAASLARDWDKVLAAVAKELASVQKRAAEVRQAGAVAEARAADLNRKLAPFRAEPIEAQPAGPAPEP